MLAVRTTTLNRIVGDLNATDDIEVICQVLANSAHWLLDCDICGLALVDDHDHVTFRLVAPYDLEIWSLIPGGTIDEQLRSVRASAISNSREYPLIEQFAALPAVPDTVRSWLWVPLRAGDIHCGTLLLGSFAPNCYGSDDIHIAYMFGVQLSAALQRAKLALRLRQEHANTTTLYQVLRDLATMTRVDELLARFIQVGVLITGAEHGTLLQIDPDERELAALTTWPHTLDAADQNLAAIAAHGYFPEVISTMEPLLISDVQHEHRWTPQIAAEEAAHALLAVPIAHQGRLNGVLRLTNSTAGIFEAEHCSMLATLAQQVSIMLENVRFNEQQNRLFHQYVATNVADLLLTNPQLASLGGQRQTVTVFFADIENFTPFAEQHSPEQLITILNDYLGIVATVIQEHGGTLDKFMGDAVMAFFNAPVAQPDHAERAARAAIRVQQLIRAYHRLIATDESLKFRIGLHTGEAVVGNIGTQTLRNYTVIGDVVNTAKRIQESSSAGEILVSAACRAQLGPSLSTEYAGDIALKGKSDPQPLYWLRPCVQPLSTG